MSDCQDKVITDITLISYGPVLHPPIELHDDDRWLQTECKCETGDGTLPAECWCERGKVERV